MNKSKIRIFNCIVLQQFSQKSPVRFPIYNLEFWVEREGICYRIFWL